MSEQRIVVPTERIVVLPVRRGDGTAIADARLRCASADGQERAGAAAPDATCVTTVREEGTRPPSGSGPLSGVPARVHPSDAEIALWFG